MCRRHGGNPIKTRRRRPAGLVLLEIREGKRMRKQYHFRRSPQGLCAWDVHRLVELSKDLVRERIPLSAIRELDEPYWANERAQPLTCREIVGHARLMLDCNLNFPVILSSDGRVMDGMHRICQALLQGLTDIEAVRLVHDPEPDYIGVHPDDLPYDE
jgi:hypothetical protein